MPKQHVQLIPEARDTLTTLTTQGDQKARRYKRALGLLELDRGKTHTPKLQDPRHAPSDPSCLDKEIPHTRLGRPQRCPALRTPGGDHGQATRPNHRLGLFHTTTRLWQAERNTCPNTTRTGL